MLSVGRELNIHNQSIVCLICRWEGAGAELATGLIPVEDSAFSVYAYRCPACDSFNLSRQGKLLPFRSPPSTREENPETTSSTSDYTIPSQGKGKIL
jgi:hypothetical protein